MTIDSSPRLWLFRVLVMVAAGLLLLSWFLPWWAANVSQLGTQNHVIIHPWYLEIDMQVYYYIAQGSDMPGWFAPVMWAYLGLAIAALLIGAWIKDKSLGLLGRRLNLSRWLVGFIGFSYIVVVILAVIVAAIRTGDFGLNLLKGTYISFGGYEQSWVTSRLLFGYWLACGVGPLLIVLALLRNKIIGKI
jgi:hypothetical protein